MSFFHVADCLGAICPTPLCRPMVGNHSEALAYSSSSCAPHRVTGHADRWAESSPHADHLTRSPGVVPPAGQRGLSLEVPWHVRHFMGPTAALPLLTAFPGA